MRALVIGHFSTVGDIEVLREVERQLASADMLFDVAPIAGGMVRFDPGWLDVRGVNPRRYTHLLVVCGPFWRDYYIRKGVDLDAFAHCTRIGVNLSMIEDVDCYNPFDRLIGRDNSNWSRPDISFLHEAKKVPVAGLCLVGAQREYGDRQKHDVAGDLLRRLARRNGMAVIETDTEWPLERNVHAIGTPGEFEAICARVDVMLTTRLHGTVLSLKNGVPVIAIDAIAGGGKVMRQAQAIGWQEVFAVGQVTDAALDEALARCLLPSGRDRAMGCAADARVALAGLPGEFAEALSAVPQGKPSFTRPAVKASKVRGSLRKLASRVAGAIR